MQGHQVFRQTFSVHLCVDGLVTMLGPMLYVLCAAPASNIIQKYSMQHESFADEAQFQNFQKI